MIQPTSTENAFTERRSGKHHGPAVFVEEAPKPREGKSRGQEDEAGQGEDPDRTEARGIRRHRRGHEEDTDADDAVDTQSKQLERADGPGRVLFWGHGWSGDFTIKPWGTQSPLHPRRRGSYDGVGWRRGPTARPLGDERDERGTDMRWIVFLGGLAVAAFPAIGVGQGTPTPSQEVAGSYTYQTYCATCHGTKGKGDGPLADSLRFRPPDLTELAKRNDGVFPADKVARIVDGRDPVNGHGGPDMPVWGDAFKNSEDGFDDEQVKQKIQSIVAYLGRLQEK